MPAAASGTLDLNSIAANLSVFALAVAAVVGGCYKAWSDIKKKLTGGDNSVSRPTDDLKVLSAALMETTSMNALTESNRHLSDQLRQLCTRIEELVEGIRDHRSSTRSMHEEAHRLRVAVNDAYELLREFRR